MHDEQQVNAPEWQSLKSHAVFRKHEGDIIGAIGDMEGAIRLARDDPALRDRTASMLNFLADLYIRANMLDRAEESAREAIGLSRGSYPIDYADNLLLLALVLSKKGERSEALVRAEEAASLYRQSYQQYPGRVQEVEEQVERIRAAR